MADISVALERLDDSFHFVARNNQGIEVHIDDATARAGGVGLGAGPMQLLLMGLGGCSGVDMASILAKSRQQVDAFRIFVNGHKPDGTSPSLYDTIHVRFELEGPLDVDRVRRAVDLSLGKYCSVAKTLERTATITASYVVNGDEYSWEGG